MGSATWRCEAYVDVPPDDVYAWLTDFSTDDHASDAYKRGAGIDPRKRTKPSSRRVLSREGDVWRIEDTWGGSKFTSTATGDLAARTIRIQGGFGYEATWRATPQGAGTRLSVEGRMGKGLIGSVLKLFEARTQKSMQSDFNGHVEDLKESLAGKRG
ncbi:MAG TPA: SRPBCC family protein [Candidatus Thermoplasmatota archaeon]|nr:SRPBCC family protein [Candidatus Thermoplasmatota archaeon]